MSTTYNHRLEQLANTLNIELLEAGISDLNAHWHKEDVCSPYSRLYYVISGTGYLRIHTKSAKEEELFVLKPGYMYLIPNGLSYDYFCKDHLSKIHFHLQISMQNSLDLFLGCQDCYCLPVDIDILESLTTKMLHTKPEDFLYILSEIYRAIAAFADAANVTEKLTQHYSDVVTGLFTLLTTENIHSSTSELAQKLLMSESTLSKIFKKETGMSIGKYREQLILSRARLLLAMGEKNIGEIAEELGFRDQFYFCKYFKKRQEMTPSAYKQLYHHKS